MRRTLGLAALVACGCLPAKDLSGARCQPETGCGAGYACESDGAGGFWCQVEGGAPDASAQDAGWDGGRPDAGEPDGGAADAGDGGPGTDGGGAGDGGSGLDAGAAAALVGERLVAADFDGDGRLDLIFTDGFAGAVSRWRGTDGGFAPLGAVDAGSSGIRQLVAADFVGSPLADLLPIPSAAPSSPQVLENVGALAFVGRPFPVDLAGRALRGAASLDYDGDGLRDLAVASESAIYGYLDLHRGAGDGGYLGPVRLMWTSLADGGQMFHSVVSTAGDGGTLVAAVTNIGFRYFLVAADGGVTGASWSGSFRGARAVDFDMNGSTDFVAIDESGALEAFRNNGTGFEMDSLLRGTGSTTAPVLAGPVADFCLGGFQVTSNAAGVSLVAVSDSGVSIYPANGPTFYGYGFQDPIRLLDGGSAAVQFDVTGDGTPDLVVISAGDPPPAVAVLSGKK
ncbi:MAG: VCBS repeat-containing protein [Myxococcales bacterium]|nr:VCBS repeat-containing protein [Myxococcales bacterium]